MTYKTILVHVDQPPEASERIEIAAELALASDAHLIGSAMTDLSPFIYYVDGGFDLSDPGLAAQLDASRDSAERALQAFEMQASRVGVVSLEKRLVDGEGWPGFNLQARYCDLVVIGQSVSNNSPRKIGIEFSEYIAVNSPRPVLIVPAAGRFTHIGQRILIAWNASMEAARAVASAMPFLQRAQQVDVVVFNPDREPYYAHGAEPGADVALYLARQGIRVEVRQRTTDIDIGDALMSAAADWSSDLIVMGAYGHSRFRQVLLGGATRTVLTSMTVPVLMMH